MISDTQRWWYRDINTTGYWDAADDAAKSWYGGSSAKPVVGNWNSSISGDEIGVVWTGAQSLVWDRDINGNGVGDDSAYNKNFGLPGETPVVGNWNGSGDNVDKMGVCSEANGLWTWRLDWNGNGYWDAEDANHVSTFGLATDIPVIGNWNPNHAGDEIGVCRVDNGQYRWYLDLTGDGWWGEGDTCQTVFGWEGSTPIAGDWSGDGTCDVGVYAPNASGEGRWYRDVNSNEIWDATDEAAILQYGWVFPTLTFQDADVEEQTQKMFFAGGDIGRDGMIDILTDIGADNNVVDSTELTDCRMLVTNAADLSMPDFVQVLSDNVVNTNPANTYYQGDALGNLAASDASTKLDKLVNKWFKGLDHPDTAYNYQQAAGSLFVSGPSVSDMDQGALGDCYFIGALGSIADSDASAIENMFVDNGDGTYTVRFYYDDDGYVADYVTVDGMLPVNGNYLVYAGETQAYSNSSNELWMSLAEKAYAQWCETGRAEGRNAYNTYANLAGGYMFYVNEQVLGSTAGWQYVQDAYKQTLISAIAANDAVTIATKTSTSILVSSHAYVVTGYNAGNDTFVLRNPHLGTGNPNTLTWTQLKNDCEWFAAADATGTSAFGDPVSSGASAGSSSRSALATTVRSSLGKSIRGDLLPSAVDSLFGTDGSFLDEDLPYGARTAA